MREEQAKELRAMREEQANRGDRMEELMQTIIMTACDVRNLQSENEGILFYCGHYILVVIFVFKCPLTSLYLYIFISLYFRNEDRN